MLVLLTHSTLADSRIRSVHHVWNTLVCGDCLQLLIGLAARAPAAITHRRFRFKGLMGIPDHGLTCRILLLCKDDELQRVKGTIGKRH